MIGVGIQPLASLAMLERYQMGGSWWCLVTPVAVVQMTFFSQCGWEAVSASESRLGCHELCTHQLEFRR